MKKSLSRIMAAMLVAMLFATSFAAAPKALAEDYVLPEYIEFQRDNPGYLPAEKDGVVYNFYCADCFKCKSLIMKQTHMPKIKNF